MTPAQKAAARLGAKRRALLKTARRERQSERAATPVSEQQVQDALDRFQSSLAGNPFKALNGLARAFYSGEVVTRFDEVTEKERRFMKAMGVG